MNNYKEEMPIEEKLIIEESILRLKRYYDIDDKQLAGMFIDILKDKLTSGTLFDMEVEDDVKLVLDDMEVELTGEQMKTVVEKAQGYSSSDYNEYIEDIVKEILKDAPPDETGIERIDREKADELLSSGTPDKGNYRPLGKFYIEEDGIYTAIYNEDGHAWTEDFEEKRDCILWLRDEL